MISDLFTPVVIVGVLASGIRLATPYLFASIGETFGQLSGMLNLGVEGIMLMSAFFAYYTVFLYGNVWLGLLVGLIVGALVGVFTAVANVTFKSEQGISGIGFFLVGLGFK